MRHASTGLSALVVVLVGLASTAHADVLQAGTHPVTTSFRVVGLSAAPDHALIAFPMSYSRGAPDRLYEVLEDGRVYELGRFAHPRFYAVPRSLLQNGSLPGVAAAGTDCFRSGGCDAVASLLTERGTALPFELDALGTQSDEEGNLDARTDTFTVRGVRDGRPDLARTAVLYHYRDGTEETREVGADGAVPPPRGAGQAPAPTPTPTPEATPTSAAPTAETPRASGGCSASNAPGTGAALLGVLAAVALLARRRR